MSAPDLPIRLLAVTHSLSGGGAERFVSVLLSHLDRERFTPAVALAIDRRSYPVPPETPTFSLRYRGPWSLPATVKRLRGVIEEFQPQLVLSNVLSTNALTGAALRAYPTVPTWVARIGNAPELSEPWLQRWWASRCYPRAEALVSNSRRMRDTVAASYPALADRCLSLGNPTDFERLDQLALAEPLRRRQEGERVVLWIGRLSPQKRPDLALAAFAEARRRLAASGSSDRLRLRICGEGPLASEVERQAVSLGIAGVVDLLGFCDNPFAMMGEADCLLMTSDFEGLPNALIEAQGLGLPAVATACPYGPDEIVVDGVTGRLVAVGDSEAAGAALFELLADEPGRRRMGEAARLRVREQFGLDALLPRWQELLLEAAGRG